jgi:ribose 5-phosphate isomerase A
MPMDEPKRRAAAEAVRRVASGMVIGLGTGSTAAFAVEEIGDRLARGEIRDLVAIPTSNRTRELALRRGIPLTTLNERPHVDLTIDGADEVDPRGNLIKGGGGALLWEKIVAAATTTYLIIVDRSKLVPVLGRRAPLPLEVMPFGWRTHVDTVRALGAEPVLRMGAQDEPFISDGGHYILDCRFAEGILDPYFVDRELRARPGVIETGLFLGMAPEVIVGGRDAL